MKRLKKLRAGFIVSVVALTLTPSLYAADAPQSAGGKPNIVFFFVDDMGWKDLGCYGAKIYETPNIDRLCAAGVRFTQAYAAEPNCSPSRASVMTGRHPLKLGMWSPTHYIKKKDSQILPRFLHDAGYQTWHVGKWHMGNELDKTMPTDLGFDINIGGGHTWAASSYFWPYNNGPHHNHPMVGVPQDLVNRGKHGDYLTDQLTDEAVKLIEKRDPARPFYLNFWHYAVHEAHQGNPELVDKYRRKIAAAGLKRTFRVDEKTGAKLITSETDPVYAAMLESVDQSLGRIVEALKAAGQYENTLFIFSSDNGPVTEEVPCAPLLGGKNTNYEAGIRVPTFAVWPGHIKPNSQYGHTVYLPDIFDTVLAAAGVAKPKDYDGDGVSWLPIFAGEKLSPRQFFWYFPNALKMRGSFGNAAMYDEATGLKYVLNFNAYGDELFDLNKDLAEERNLIQRQPNAAKEMHEAVASFLKKYGKKARNEASANEKAAIAPERDP